MKKESTTQDVPPSGGADQSEPPVVTGGSEMRVSEDPSDSSGGSDIERLRAENEQLRATIRLEQAHRQITGELGKAEARSPELLFDSVKGELEFSDDGSVKNVGGIVERLRKSFPEQFGFDPPPSIDAGAGTANGNELTREALARMKPADIAQLDWAEVRRVLAGS